MINAVHLAHAASGFVLAADDGPYTPEEDVAGPLNMVLGYMAWFVSVAAVAGLLIIGTRMAMALRSGEGEEHLSQFAVVMGACIVGTCAGPIVSAVF